MHEHVRECKGVTLRKYSAPGAKVRVYKPSKARLSRAADS
jgi:hypothetical protein